jgi:molybdopterin synthase sulfur carrier subunit
MEIEIISFGKIAEFIPQQKISLSNVSNTDELKVYLEKDFPALADMKYKLALNKNIVQSTLNLNNNDVIALMPPFSGG